MDNLKSSWTIYQLSGSGEQTQKTWASSMKSICVVKTIPELLSTLDNLERIGIENINDLNFFKDEIQPMWEDPSNVNGGRCILEISLNAKDEVLNVWKQTVALCVSETFDTICGCTFNEKSHYRICIWISDPRENEEIINAWKKILNENNFLFSFSLHNKYSDSSKNKKKFATKNNFK